MELRVSFVRSTLTSKTRVAALAMAVLAFLQYSGIHVPPGTKELVEGIAAWGLRDAIAKGR